jgi:hypothetical protein
LPRSELDITGVTFCNGLTKSVHIVTILKTIQHLDAKNRALTAACRARDARSSPAKNLMHREQRRRSGNRKPGGAIAAAPPG